MQSAEAVCGWPPPWQHREVACLLLRDLAFACLFLPAHGASDQPVPLPPQARISTAAPDAHCASASEKRGRRQVDSREEAWELQAVRQGAVRALEQALASDTMPQVRQVRCARRRRRRRRRRHLCQRSPVPRLAFNCACCRPGQL